MRKEKLPCILVKRFAVVATLLNWDHGGHRWSAKSPIEMQCRVAHHALRRHGRANRWEINATVNDKGVETNLYGPCSGGEMLAWLDGILHGIGPARAAWQVSIRTDKARRGK